MVNKNRGRFHFRIFIKDASGFSEHQEKYTYGLGFKLTPKRNIDIDAFNRAAATANAKKIEKCINWFVLLYDPTSTQQGFLSYHIVSIAPTELHYLEGSVFRKELKAQNDWKFELDVLNEIDVSFYVSAGLQERALRDHQEHNNIICVRLTVSCAQCNIRTENYSDAGISLNYVDET